MLTLLCTPSVALAAPPPNDNFANAQPVSLPSHVTGPITGATLEPGEPDPSGIHVSTSIWYAYTPVTEQDVKVDTCDGTFYASFRVYTGASVSALTQLTRGVGACESGARATFTAAAGTTYYIAVNGYVDDLGDISRSRSRSRTRHPTTTSRTPQPVTVPGQATGKIDDATARERASPIPAMRGSRAR